MLLSGVFQEAKMAQTGIFEKTQFLVFFSFLPWFWTWSHKLLLAISDISQTKCNDITMNQVGSIPEIWEAKNGFWTKKVISCHFCPLKAPRKSKIDSVFSLSIDRLPILTSYAPFINCLFRIFSLLLQTERKTKKNTLYIWHSTIKM